MADKRNVNVTADPSFPSRGRNLRVADVLRVIVFLFALWLPCLQMNLHLFSSVDIAEKRGLAKAPGFNLRNFYGSIWQYEPFFNDNFGLRDLLVHWDGALRLKLLRVSPVSKLIFGQDGWIFYDSEKVPNDGVTINDYKGLAAYTPQQLQRIRDNLTARGQWCRAHGVQCFVVVVPNKETVYPEYLPASVRKIGPLTRLDQVLATVGVQSGLTLIDLRSALRQAKTDCPYPLYFRGGTHWNQYGAFYGYREIMRVLALSNPALCAYPLEDFDIVAEPKSAEDHWLGLAEDVRYVFRLRPSAKPPLDGGPPTKIVVIKDSFWVALGPFLALHFPDLLTQHWELNRDQSLSLIEREKPTLVVYEIAERYGDYFWNP